MKMEEKQKAILLRKSGQSIISIAKQIKVAKSSVSMWVRGVTISAIHKQQLALNSHTRDVIERRRAARVRNEELKRREVIEDAKREIHTVTPRDLKIIGTMLYWGEGGKVRKNSVRFSNSDPEMIKVIMKFFKKTCQVDERKFRGLIHIHSHLDIEKAEKYWSKISGIPQIQFFKTYTKIPKSLTGKKYTLPYGTFDIYVCDSKLFLKIIGWSEKIKQLVAQI